MGMLYFLAVIVVAVVVVLAHTVGTYKRRLNLVVKLVDTGLPGYIKGAARGDINQSYIEQNAGASLDVPQPRH
jgi:hypothetical protein